MQCIAELDQELHIEYCVAQLIGRKGANGPVGRAVALFEYDTEFAADKGSEIHPLAPQESAGELSVEQR